LKSVYLSLKPDAHMAKSLCLRFCRHSNGVLPNRRMQAANYNYFPCLTEEKS